MFFILIEGTPTCTPSTPLRSFLVAQISVTNTYGRLGGWGYKDDGIISQEKHKTQKADGILKLILRKGFQERFSSFGQVKKFSLDMFYINTSISLNFVFLHLISM